MFADGFNQPRDGPNARAVSNAFFKRKKTIYYEHTSLLLGLIEGIPNLPFRLSSLFVENSSYFTIAHVMNGLYFKSSVRDQV